MKCFTCFLFSIMLMLASSCSLKTQDDRAVFDLKGPVAEVKPKGVNELIWDDYMAYPLSFSESGELLKIGSEEVSGPNNPGYEFKRSKTGRLLSLTSVAGDGDRTLRYNYQKRGMLINFAASIFPSLKRYENNKFGRLTGYDELYENLDNGEVSEGCRVSIGYDRYGNRAWVTVINEGKAETVTYSSYEFDEVGNWISRKIFWRGHSENKFETRKITYYSE